MRLPVPAAAAALTLVLCGCGPSAPPPSPGQTAKPAAPKPPAQRPARQADLDRINTAMFDPATSAPTGKADPPDAALIRAEVLLARARFSPGAVDGKAGTNLKHALAAFQSAHDLQPTGALDADTWRALTKGPEAARAVVRLYTTTAADIAGPFAADVGEDFVKLAALPDGPQFTSPLEALAERFHMSQDLLQALNPGVDLTKPGQALMVADAEAPSFAKGDVKTIAVSKAKAELVAYGPDGQVAAVYPATVGSTERPSPSGVHKVNGVAQDPDYVYDPKKLHWGPRSHGKLTVKPGPNNPVGVVWIDLNAPGYGIHGSPDPEKIGKTASHGCVRLTNWDAEALAAGVRPGVVVTFEGKRS